MLLSARRGLSLAVVLAMVAALLSFPAAATASAPTWTFSPDDEAAYVARINAIRAEHGLGPLVVDANMTAAARDWTVWMAENSTLAHADDIVVGAPSDWLKVGENVGRGGTLEAVWQAFLASPSHAANVLDPVYDYVGIGVIWTAEGRLYTTHRFASTESAEVTAEPNPPTPEAEAGPDTAPEQLPFGEPEARELDATTPADPSEPAGPGRGAAPPARPAEPARVATTMALLLEAG